MITAVGRDLPVGGPDVLDASGMLVLPEFVDTPRHTWQSVGPASQCRRATNRAEKHTMETAYAPANF